MDECVVADCYGWGVDQSGRPVELLSDDGEERTGCHYGEERGGEYDGSD